jgi:primosomal protein N' (replication factor Y)
MADQSAPLARVVLPLPLQESFIYRVPPELAGQVRRGSQVSVPFRSRRLRGFVVELVTRLPKARLKGIAAVIGETIDENILRLTQWTSEYYMAPWGEVLRAAVPRPVGRVRIPESAGDGLVLTCEEASHSPTPQQGRALEAVRAHLEGGSGFKPFLLHGVTGSGKTFVYCRAAAEVVKKGGSCLVLVPEISLSTQLVDRFRQVFGDEVVLSHSGLSPSERYTAWLRAQSGEAKILVGARSAVFSPFKNLALIVVDEEHEPSYKQSEVPRYNARDVAVKRAQLDRCPVLLGSATPSLESYHNAVSGKYTLLRLSERVDSRPMASVHIVDLRSGSTGEDGSWLFSDTLKHKMQERIEKNEQVILFINRRGHSTFIQCRECGHSFHCPRCEVSLTYHSDPHRLTCHYCGYSAAGVEVCPKCGGSNFWFGGVGTQKVEREILKLFPEAGVLRMDTDSTRRRGAQRAMVRAFSAGQSLILLGTQMVAKGLDFPGVTLVGVIYADTQLNLPDFRASERTFQLLTQVAGRAGRGTAPGEVVIQTFLPDHPSLKAAAMQDFEMFYRSEAKDRQELLFPPFSRIVDLSFTGREEDEVVQCSRRVAYRFKELLKRRGLSTVEVMGPAPYPLARIRNKVRWHVTLRGTSTPELRSGLDLVGEVVELERPKRVAVGVDVDPLQLM